MLNISHSEITGSLCIFLTQHVGKEIYVAILTFLSAFKHEKVTVLVVYNILVLLCVIAQRQILDLQVLTLKINCAQTKSSIKWSRYSLIIRVLLSQSIRFQFSQSDLFQMRRLSHSRKLLQYRSM